MAWIAYLIIGAIAGWAAGFLGIGGGLLIVPALAIMFAQQFPGSPWIIHMAVATSLASITVTALSATWGHQRQGAIDWALVGRLTPFLLLGAALGSWLATAISGLWLARLFAIYALIMGLNMLRTKAAEKPRFSLKKRFLGSGGALIGALSAMVGIGGGSFTVPWLAAAGIRIQSAIAVSAVCGFPIAVAASLSYVYNGWDTPLPAATLGFVYLPAFAGIAIASVLTAPLGTWWVHRSSPRRVGQIFGAVLILMALRMAIKSL